MRKTKYILLLFSTIIIVSCNTKTNVENTITDPLPSWNEGRTKSAIIDFVTDVTNPSSAGYIKAEDRIATFDNDGNLWSEQPFYFQLFFAIDRVKQLTPEHPEWKTQEPFKWLLEDNLVEFLKSGEHGLLEVIMTTHANLTTDEFETIVKNWLATAKHPRFNRPYTDLVYQPMLELLDYLRANDFKTFIVSGGGIDFMRPWVEEVYGIPKNQVVGSSVKTQFVIREGKPLIERLPEIDFIDDKEGKPVGINKFIGRKPVFASGNSDGDLAMLQYTASGEGRRFMLYLHHTDEVREWAYDRDSKIGKLDKGLDEALEKGWTVIDMKNDWKVIYPFEKEK